MKLLAALSLIVVTFLISFWVMMSEWGIIPKDWGVIIIGNILAVTIGAVGQDILSSK